MCRRRGPCFVSLAASPYECPPPKSVCKDGYIEDLWRRVFVEGDSARGPRLQFTRWGSLVDVAQAWAPKATAFLIKLLWLGLQIGYLGRQSGGCLKVEENMATTPSAGGAGSSSSGAASSSAAPPLAPSTSSSAPKGLAELRSKCRNTMHLVTLVLLDGRHRIISRLFGILPAPLRRWHGQQAAHNSSIEKVHDFYISMAEGAWLRPLCEIIGLLRDPTAIDDIGLLTSKPAWMTPQNADDAIVLEQEGLSSLVGSFAVQLLRSRVCGMLQFAFGLPQRFLLLESADARLVASELAWMREAVEAWSWAGSSGSATLQAFHKKSFIGWLENRIMLSYCEHGNWREITSTMREFLKNLFGNNLGQTVSCELAFQRCRRAESRDQSDSHRLRPAKAWFEPLKHNVLSGHQSFDEVQYSSMPRPTSKTVPAAFFRVPPTASYNFSPIASSSSTAAWPSFTAQTSACLYAELAVMMECHREQNAALADSSWLSGLLEPGIVVRRLGSDQLFMSLGPIQGHAALGWPCKRFVQGVETWFELKPDATRSDLTWLVVTSLPQWRAFATEWSSPLFQQLYAKKDGRCITLRARSCEKELLTVAANMAFWKLQLPFMKRLYGYLQADGVAGETLFAYVHALVAHVLPDLDAQEIAEILEARLMQRKFAKSELLQEQCVADVFEADKESNILEKHLEYSRPAAMEFEEFHSALVKMRAKAGAKTGGKAKAAAKAARPKKVAWPTSLTQAYANSLAPPGCHISKDGANQRWLGCMRPHGTISRSWPLYGERVALSLVLSSLWTWHRQLTGAECPWEGLS